MRRIDADKVKAESREHCKTCVLNGTKHCDKTCVINLICDRLDLQPTIQEVPHEDLISRSALKKEVENLVAGGAERLKDYYENGSMSDQNSWIGGVYDAWELISYAPTVCDEDPAIPTFNREELEKARDYWYNHLEVGNEEQNEAAWAAINAIRYCIDHSSCYQKGGAE